MPRQRKKKEINSPRARSSSEEKVASTTWPRIPHAFGDSKTVNDLFRGRGGSKEEEECLATKLGPTSPT